MKAFFAVIAVVIVSVSMLSAFLPEAALAAEKKITVAEMTAIKKAADEAVTTAKVRVEKAKNEEEKSLAEELLEYAMINAQVAADLLKTVQEGGNIDRKEAERCAAIAKEVHKAAAAIAAGDVKKAGQMLDGIAKMEDALPTAAASFAELSISKTVNSDTSQTSAMYRMYELGNISKPFISSEWKDAAEFYCSDYTGIKKWLCEKFIKALFGTGNATVAECQIAKERCDISCSTKYSDNEEILSKCLADCVSNYTKCIINANK